MDPETLKLIGGGTTIGALLALIYIVGMKMASAIDRLGVKQDEHAEAETLHHVAVRSEIAAMNGRMGGIMDAAGRLTPAGGVRAPTER